jgi:hypothetical protein
MFKRREGPVEESRRVGTLMPFSLPGLGLRMRAMTDEPHFVQNFRFQSEFAFLVIGLDWFLENSPNVSPVCCRIRIPSRNLYLDKL